MTQTLVLSDIHGNHPALSAVLEDAFSRFQLDDVWCLGDTFGYGPFPLHVWRELRNLPIPAGGWLAGNHEMGVLGRAHGPALMEGLAFSPYFRIPAWMVIKIHQAILDGREEVLSHLRSLPSMSSPKPGVYLVHGGFIEDAERSVHIPTKSPSLSPREFVDCFMKAASRYPDLVYLSNKKKSTPQIFAFGHTHLPGIWRWHSEGQNKEWIQLDLQNSHDFGDLKKSPIAFNPGSVGFPRAGNRCPSYVMLDWEARRISLHHVKYDVELIRVAMQESPYKELLAEKGFLVDPMC